MLANLPRPVIFAHRGASAYAPENTLAAFELAMRQGADAIELDAKLTSDGHVVVFHDQTVERTTGAAGWVKDLPLAALRKLDAGSHFDFAFRGEPIPILEEVLDAVGQLAFINIELTNYASLFDELPEKVARLVKNHKLTQRVMASSFNPVALRRFHVQLPQIPIGLLARPGGKGWLARSRAGRWLCPHQTLHPSLADTTQELVEYAHKSGRMVFVYTVNHSEDMRRLIQLGVDGFFTDDPLLARQVLSRVDH